MNKLTFTLMLAFACLASASAQKLQFHKEKTDNGTVYTYQTEDGEDYCSVYMVKKDPDKFVNGLQRIVKDGKIGFINKDGIIVIVPQYDVAGQFIGKYSLVNKGAHNVATDPQAEPDMQGGLWGVIDKKGKVIMPCGYNKVWDESKKAYIYHNGTKGFEYTNKGKLIQTTQKK